MNIAILGSAGQIGAYLKEYLKEKGHEVVGVDIVDGPQNDLRVTPNTYVESQLLRMQTLFSFFHLMWVVLAISKSINILLTSSITILV